MDRYKRKFEVKKGEKVFYQQDNVEEKTDRYIRLFTERKKVGTQYEVMEAIKKTLMYYYDDMYQGDLYPYSANEALEEVESNPRPGFIPYTDGGFQITGFVNLGDFPSTGYSVKPKEAKKRIDKMVDYSYEWAMEEFMKDNQELVDELGKDKINYHDLYDAGYDDKAEELAENEYEMMADDQILFQIGVFYYNKENTKGDFEGEYDSVYVYGIINWESPYHRSGKNNEWVAKNSGSIKIDPDSKKFKKQLADKVKKIVGEF